METPVPRRSARSRRSLSDFRDGYQTSCWPIPLLMQKQEIRKSEEHSRKSKLSHLYEKWCSLLESSHEIFGLCFWRSSIYLKNRNTLNQKELKWLLKRVAWLTVVRAPIRGDQLRSRCRKSSNRAESFVDLVNRDLVQVPRRNARPSRSDCSDLA